VCVPGTGSVGGGGTNGGGDGAGGEGSSVLDCLVQPPIKVIDIARRATSTLMIPKLNLLPLCNRVNNLTPFIPLSIIGRCILKHDGEGILERGFHLDFLVIQISSRRSHVHTSQNQPEA